MEAPQRGNKEQGAASERKVRQNDTGFRPRLRTRMAPGEAWPVARSRARQQAVGASGWGPPVDDPGTVRPVCKGGLGSLSGRDPRTPQAGSACSAPRGPDPDGAPPALFLTARAARGGHSRATGPRALRTPALMPANRVCAPYFRARAACPDGSGKERSGQIRTDRRGPRRTVASLPPQPGQRPDQNGIAPITPEAPSDGSSELQLRTNLAAA